MGKFFAWFFAAAIVIGACNNLLESMADPTTTTTSTTTSTSTTTTIVIADPEVPVLSDGTGGLHIGGVIPGSGSSNGSPRGGSTRTTQPSYDGIDCGSPEDAIDNGWDEEDVLDYCAMDDSELDPEYQDG